MRERGRTAVVILGVLAAALAGWLFGSRGASPPSTYGGGGDAERLRDEVARLEARVRELEARPATATLAPAAESAPTRTAEPKTDAHPERPDPSAAKPTDESPRVLTGPGLEGLRPRVVAFAPKSTADAKRIADLVALVDRDRAFAEGRIRSMLAGDDREIALSALETVADASWVPLMKDAIADERLDLGARQRIANRVAPIQDRSWSAKQMTGAPDVPGSGDIGTAWASKREDMGEVWVELDYPRAVRVDGVRVRETLNPGAVARVYAKDPQGAWDLLWEGRDPSRDSPCWFEPAVRGTAYATSHLRLVVDTDRVPGWNEVDSVELVGDGERQWASDARAQSSYSD